MEYPYFSIRTKLPKRTVFITRDINGKILKINLWELIEKYGAEEVLKMRQELPEVIEDEKEKD